MKVNNALQHELSNCEYNMSVDGVYDIFLIFELQGYGQNTTISGPRAAFQGDFVKFNVSQLFTNEKSYIRKLPLLFTVD